MKFLKQCFLVLSCSIIIAPINGVTKFGGANLDAPIAQQPITRVTPSVPLEYINHDHVQTAKNDLIHEAQWANPVRYAIAGVALAALTYGAYKWLKPEPTITADAYKTFRDLSNLDQSRLVSRASAIFDAWHKKTQLIMQNAADEHNQLPFYTKIGSWAKDNAYWLGSIALSQIALGATIEAASNGLTALNYYIPTTGTLHWFITSRTEYDRNIKDLTRYLEFPELFQDEITDVVHLMTTDLEKIVGYLNYFEGVLKQQVKAAPVVQRCISYYKNIELLTNNLADAINHAAPMQDILVKISLVAAEVQSARSFVGANYR